MLLSCLSFPQWLQLLSHAARPFRSLTSGYHFEAVVWGGTVSICAAVREVISVIDSCINFDTVKIKFLEQHLASAIRSVECSAVRPRHSQHD